MGLEIDFTKQDQAHQPSKRFLFSKPSATGSAKAEANVDIKKDDKGWSVKIGVKAEAEGTVTVGKGGNKGGKESTGGSSSSGGGGGWWRRR